MAINDLRPNIGVLAEQVSGERCVALVPADVRRLAKLASITVERGAGLEAGHPDEAYVDAGATTAWPSFRQLPQSLPCERHPTFQVSSPEQWSFRSVAAMRTSPEPRPRED
jgi:Alanine dehydrogenase/PNT, N-terminal domain